MFRQRRLLRLLGLEPALGLRALVEDALLLLRGDVRVLVLGLQLAVVSDRLLEPIEVFCILIFDKTLRGPFSAI